MEIGASESNGLSDSGAKMGARGSDGLRPVVWIVTTLS